MNTFSDLVRDYHVCRHFAKRPIDAESVELLLRSALSATVFKGGRDVHLVVVDEAHLIEKIADANAECSMFLAGAPLVVAILCSDLDNDLWVEDCSSVASVLAYQAEELGLGSCCARIKGLWLSDGTSSETVIRGVLGIPDEYKVLCVVGLGYEADACEGQADEDLLWENVHINTF